MASLSIEPRPNGSLLLTQRGRARWELAIAGLVSGGFLLATILAGGVSVLGGVVIAPLALIVILAGLGAARHRDWILFDRPAREIAFRRGLASIFRPVSALPFDEVEAVLVDPLDPSEESISVKLLREGDYAWHLDESPDPAYVSQLVRSLHDVGGWPVLQGGVPLSEPYEVAGRRA